MQPLRGSMNGPAKKNLANRRIISIFAENRSYVKLKRTILSLLLSCIYMLATLGTVLFDTCAACCSAHDHAVACERCCHCGSEDHGAGNSRHFACNCPCHLHSHDTSDGNVVVVLAQGRDDLSKKLVKKNVSEAGTLFVLPSEANISLLREGTRMLFGGEYKGGSLRLPAIVGLRAPPVLS